MAHPVGVGIDRGFDGDLPPNRRLELVTAVTGHQLKVDDPIAARS